MQIQHFIARRENTFLADGNAGRGIFALTTECFLPRQRQNLFFRRRIRVINIDVHQKTVELRFGQRVSAFLLDRVLRRHHHKQLGQFVGGPADCDLALGHGFEQRRLHFRRRTVDLVSEHQIVEQRPLLEHEGAILRPVDFGAGEVGGQ